MIAEQVALMLCADMVHGTLVAQAPDGSERFGPVLVGGALETLTVGSVIYRLKGGWTEIHRSIPGTRRVFSEDGQLFSEILLNGRHRLVARLH